MLGRTRVIIIIIIRTDVSHDIQGDSCGRNLRHNSLERLAELSHHVVLLTRRFLRTARGEKEEHDSAPSQSFQCSQYHFGLLNIACRPWPPYLLASIAQIGWLSSELVPTFQHLPDTGGSGVFHRMSHGCFTLVGDICEPFTS